LKALDEDIEKSFFGFKAKENFSPEIFCQKKAQLNFPIFSHHAERKIRKLSNHRGVIYILNYFTQILFPAM